LFLLVLKPMIFPALRKKNMMNLSVQMSSR
jgi:hypothetical protein